MTAGRRTVFSGSLDDLVDAVRALGIPILAVQHCSGAGGHKQVCLGNGAYVNWWESTGTLVVHGKPIPRNNVEDRLFASLGLSALTDSHPRQTRTATVPRPAGAAFDLFLSHASEDKDTIARPLYVALTSKGFSVWFDEAVLEIGDSLRRKIDEGLSRCRYGVVILSHSFFAKEWPQRELDGLVARETATGDKAVLPVWHEVERADVMAYSPTLADRIAARSTAGVDACVTQILRVLLKP